VRGTAGASQKPVQPSQCESERLDDPPMTLAPASVTVLLALAAAFLFALSDQIAHRGLETADARSGAVVSVAASALFFWLFAPWLVQADYWWTSAALLFAVVGIFRPALSIYLAMIGMGYLGPTLASAFTASSPLWGSLLAMAILGEQMTPAIALGTMAVVAGAVVAAYRPQGLLRNWPLWALLFPVSAAIVRAGGHVAIKFGYEELPSPYFASLVSITVSAILGWAVFRLQGLRFKGGADARQWFAAYKWFAVSGTLNGLSIFALNTALAQGSVVTVMPIASAGPVFTLLLGLFVFRREHITWRTVASIALVISGVLLVILR
jgi:drug/metabolite transporter, DME family